jgi:hypothetical protein
MRRSFLLGAVTVVLVASVFAGTQKLESFKGEDVTNAEIIGVLGKPLGTVCRIQGVAEKDPNTLNKGYDPERVFLKVTSVDGGDVAEPIFFDSRQVKGLEHQPSAGDQINYLVYESGSFAGPLADPNELLGKAKPKLVPQTNDRNWDRYHLKIELNIAQSR